MQTSAIDRDQQAYQARKTRQRDARVAELWRWLLTQKMGRELLWDVLLADLGYDQPIRLAYETEQPSPQQVALHNLAVRWLNGQVRRHRDLYLQMLNEASKREDDERKEDETMRRAWASQDEDLRND